MDFLLKSSCCLVNKKTDPKQATIPPESLLRFRNQKGYRIVFFLPEVLEFLLLSFLVPFALYLQQFGTRTCHFAWYLLHFGMVTLHFALYLPHFGTSTSHLHGICYIAVLQTFMWGSWGFFRLSFRVLFKVSFRVSFKVSFRASLRFHLGFRLGFLLGFFSVSFRVL